MHTELYLKARHLIQNKEWFFQCYNVGYDSFNGVNLSGLFSFLIKEAGRLCDSYSSDMFYTLKELERAISGTDNDLVNKGGYWTVIGIRDMGVDHLAWVEHRVEEMSCERNYRKMYMVEVLPDEVEASVELFNELTVDGHEWEKSPGLWNLRLYQIDAGMMDYYKKKTLKWEV